MCKFFSYISKGDGKFLYLNAEHRKLALEGKLIGPCGNKIDNVDSHSSIASFFGMKDDLCNKYEYLADEDKFLVDQINAKVDDRVDAEIWAKALPYATLCKLKNLGMGNIGDRNSGDRNSGDRNSGNWNSGNWNSGNWNSGDSNSGDWNSGDSNSGDWNSGDSNSGDWNSGDFNSGSYNAGLFCTNTPNVRLFNRNSKIPRTDARIQKVLYLGPSLTAWVYLSEMTADEQSKYPSAQTTGGYLKKLDYKEAWGKYWKETTEDNRKAFLDLPFFDAEIFFEITGVRVEQPKRSKK